MSKVQPAISMMEQQLHQKDIVIEKYDKQMALLKAQNEELMQKVSSISKIQKGRVSM
jgi:hypothetical protein